jgi:hypothetical protein|tara:strand:+ start:20326 stop:20595 length:270 start_codon:yes stop_codon:yes gene_type:complete
MNPTREDLIELGYLKPGDTYCKIPKRLRKVFLTESDLEYADRHGLTRQEMRDFKEEMMIEDEIIRDHRILAAQEKKDHFNSPQAHYFAW